MENKTTIIGAISIIIVALIIGISIYNVQNNKAESIERQKRAERVQEMLLAEQKKCDNMLPGIQKQWGNIVGIEYIGSAPYSFGECWVTYIDPTTDTIMTARLSSMETVK